jgi:competence protein ComEA
VEQQFPWRVLEDGAHTVSPSPGSPRPPGNEPAAAPGASNAAVRRPVLGLVALAAAAVAVVAAAAVVIGGLSSPALVVPGGPGSPLELSRVRADGTADQRPGGAVAAPDAPVGSAAAQALVVDVAGAVRNPGIYRFTPGARVADAVTAAGGFGPRVDVEAASRINLAAELHDGEQVRVPSRDDSPSVAPVRSPTSAGAPDSAGVAPAGLVDVNTASAGALDALPGIGPATSAKIIAAREDAPFASVDELRSRGVLGEATFGKVRDLVTVGP